ncbi:hypothetical protein [Sporosarcina sp. FSL W7-1283]|uniref:hypothetical protein n=1 Tax=Sporosarcina sp. FSL W7-1283 TaxID=2921560 RepID=UPI0030F4CF0D
MKNSVAGIIKIAFVANITEQILQEEFNDFLIRRGIVQLTNMAGCTIDLEIHEHEIEYLDVAE